MEIGSLASWVEGISESLALIVALFLPIVTEKQNSKRAQQKLQRIGVRLVNQMVEEKQKYPDQLITETENYKEFNQYITTVSIINDDQQTVTVLMEMNELLQGLDRDTYTIEEAKSKIKELEKE